MKDFIEKLKEELENQLSIHHQEKQPLRRFALCKQVVQDSIERLHQFAVDYCVADPEDIILYNRQWAPFFYGKLVYFSKCYGMECINLSSSMEEKRLLYEHELTAIRHFFLRFSSFCQHYYSDTLGNDDVFLPKEHFESLSYDEILIEPETPLKKIRLLTGHLLANEEYRSFLEEELKELYSLPVFSGPEPEWAYTAAALTEVISSLFEAKAVKVSGKPASKRYIQVRLEAALGGKINDIDIVDNNNRFRQKEAEFLDHLKACYVKRGKRLEEAKNEKRAGNKSEKK